MDKMSRNVAIALLLALLLVPGCTTIKNTMNDPVVQHCALQTVGGAVIGGVVGNTIGDSKSSKRAGTIIGGAAGGAAAFLLCRRAFNQAQELKQRIAELEAQQQQQLEAPTLTADNEPTSEEAGESESPRSSQGEGAMLPKGDTPSGPMPTEGNRVVENLEVVDNRAIRLDLNSSLVFDTGEFELQERALPHLAVMAEVFNTNPGTEIHLLGHTDNVGSARSNQRLSERRAEAVAEYLSGNGVDPERLKPEGLGEEEPVGDNATPEGRSQNRRVEVVVVPASA